MEKKTTMLMILDGFGINENENGNEKDINDHCGYFSHD